MLAQKITIKNVLGLESLEINPGTVTVISGENASGKTSCLEAIRAALNGAHDATLLKQGAEKGEIVLVLEDGTEIQKRITPDKSSLKVIHPELGKISKPASYLKKLADSLSLNPIQFLTAAKKDRVNQLLQAIPMEVTADQIKFVPVEAVNGISLDAHALEVLGRIGKNIYDLRTGINRAAKEKRATASQMEETLPEDAPEGQNWQEALDEALDKNSVLQRGTSAQINEIKSLFIKRRDELEGRFNQHKGQVEVEASKRIDDLRAEFEREVEKVRADSAIEIEASRQKNADAIKAARQEQDKDLSELEKEYRPKEAELKEKIGQAKAMVEQHARAESTREFIRDLNEQSGKLESQSAKFTKSLEQLEMLKSSLLEKLPIKGLSVQEGDIFMDGIPWERVNESKRIRLAIEIAKLRAGSLGLVAVDGLERLDPKTFEAFKKEAAKTKLQFVISRVTDGPLAIETEGAA